jgi:hypothetical protein
MAVHRLDGPRWRGPTSGESIAGRPILLHEEGGFGDTLQFIRYVPKVAALGAHVTVRVQPELRRLLQRSLPGIEILTTDDPLPAYDVHAPLLSLPRCFRTTLQTVPAQVPYIAAAGPGAGAEEKPARWPGLVRRAPARHGADARDGPPQVHAGRKACAARRHRGRFIRQPAISTTPAVWQPCSSGDV